MKTNAVINKVDYFLSNIVMLIALLYRFTFGSVGNSFNKLALVAFLLLNISFSFGQSKTVLKVQNDRINRSTTLKGTYYKLELTNSGVSDTYDLSYVNVNEKSTNPDGSSVKENVKLKITFMTKDFRPITQLKVNSGETINFLAYIEVPQGTAFDKWSSNNVIAASRSNSNNKVDTVLHTVVINTIDN